MDWEELLLQVIGAAIISGLTIYMNNSANRLVVKKNNQQIVLRVNRLYQIMGIIGILIALVYIVMAVYFHELFMYLLGIAMVGLFGGLGVPCFLTYQNHTLRFDDEKMVVSDWTGKLKTVYWKDIKDIRFKRISGHIVIKNSKTQVKISQHLVGLKTFLDTMESVSPWNARRLGLPT